MGRLTLWMSGLFLAGCVVTQPLPTIVSTVVVPTPTPTSPPVPTRVRPSPTPIATNFPAWRRVTLQSGQSFDFRQETMGIPTAGDLYYSAFNPRQGTACFWANNASQVGGRDLGAWPLTALTEQPLPRDRYSSRCIPVIRGHVYVYGIRRDERLAIFRVVDTGLDAVTFDYALRRR
jgi:hypothetical protein